MCTFRSFPFLKCQVVLQLLKLSNYCVLSSIFSLVLVPVGWGFLVVSKYDSRLEKVNINVQISPWENKHDTFPL